MYRRSKIRDQRSIETVLANPQESEEKERGVDEECALKSFTENNSHFCTNVFQTGNITDLDQSAKIHFIFPFENIFKAVWQFIVLLLIFL